MKTKILITLFTLMALLVFNACNEDYLEKFPLDSPSSETFYSNEAELSLAVNAIYRNLIDYGANWLPGRMFPRRLDWITDIGWERYGIDVGTGEHDSESGWPNALWGHLYEGIAKANYLLYNMENAREEVDPEVFNRIKGEALTLRAYFYMHLTELFGDVPLITEPKTLEEAFVSRNTKSEVVDQILNDLEEAAGYLFETYTGNDKGRITKGAALTMKARTALYNEMWDVVIDATERVINSGVYSIYPDYYTLHTYEGEGNEEIILDYQMLLGVETHGAPQDQLTRNTGGWSVPIPLQSLIDSYEAIDGLPIDESPLYDPANPFENRDPRLDQTIVRDGAVWGGYVFYSHPDSAKTWFIQGGDSTRVDNQDVLNPYATFSGYTWKKAMDPADFDTKRESGLNVVLSRYAEVLLMYAEAKIEKGDIDQSVLDAINEIRQRPSVQMPEITTMDQDELRKAVRQERKIELAYEGFRYYDLKRWGIAEKALNIPVYGRPQGSFSTQGIPDIDEDGIPHYDAYADQLRKITDRNFDPARDYLWPIPQSEIDVNSNLTQNPNY